MSEPLTKPAISGDVLMGEPMTLAGVELVTVPARR